MAVYIPVTHAERRTQNLNSEQASAAAEKHKMNGNLTNIIDAEFEEVVPPSGLLPPRTQGEK